MRVELIENRRHALIALHQQHSQEQAQRRRGVFAGSLRQPETADASGVDVVLWTIELHLHAMRFQRAFVQEPLDMTLTQVRKMPELDGNAR
jgi:hypothetical protein